MSPAPVPPCAVICEPSPCVTSVIKLMPLPAFRLPSSVVLLVSIAISPEGAAEVLFSAVMVESSFCSITRVDFTLTFFLELMSSCIIIVSTYAFAPAPESSPLPNSLPIFTLPSASILLAISIFPPKSTPLIFTSPVDWMRPPGRRPGVICCPYMFIEPVCDLSINCESTTPCSFIISSRLNSTPERFMISPSAKAMPEVFAKPLSLNPDTISASFRVSIFISFPSLRLTPFLAKILPEICVPS